MRDVYKKTRIHILTEDYSPGPTISPWDGRSIIYNRDIHIWTDSSALDNGFDNCTARPAWTSDLGFDDKVRLTGAYLSNNEVEVAMVVLCLLVWRDAHIVVHTDSTLVLGLIGGGLLAMERDSWGNAPRHLSQGPPAPLLQYLLYLLRDRAGRISFVKAKAHGNNIYNNIADEPANQGQLTGRVMDIGSLKVPAGWVDTSPVLCYQPLDYLTRLVVCHKGPPPTGTIKFCKFSDRWTVLMGLMFDKVLDPSKHIGGMWCLHVPEGLKEVLWKEMNGALVLGRRYFGKSETGCVCMCGQEMSLDHILSRCSRYDLKPLLQVLLDGLCKVSPAAYLKTLHPDEWTMSPWYPLLVLHMLEQNALRPTNGLHHPNKALRASWLRREWLIGSYFWALWKWHMKEIHDDTFQFKPQTCVEALENMLSTQCLVSHTGGNAGDDNQPPAAKHSKTDGTYT